MKYSQELVDEICLNIENGILNIDAAQLSGISEETFYNWQRPLLPDGKTSNPSYHPEFSESIKRAEAKRKRNFIAQITRASRTEYLLNGDGTYATDERGRRIIVTRGQWQASAWYLERVYPEEFGRQRAFEVKGDGNITVTIKDYE